jgi:DNA-binding MarR family transcriptional regulator
LSIVIDIKQLQSLNDVFTNVMKQIFLSPASSCDVADQEMTVTQKKVLFFLAEQGTQKMSTIARQLGVAMSAATATVDKMVRSELVVREFDPSDRRVIRIALSDKGRQALEAALQAQARCFEEILERLEPHKRTELLQSFTRIHELLSEIQLPGAANATPSRTDLRAALSAHPQKEGQP